MRFMTFNIKLGLQAGIRPVVELVRDVEPDVLALQEVGSQWRMGPRGHTAARIALQTGLDHWHFAPTIVEAGAIRYGHALLSRWPIRRRERHDFTRQEDEPRCAVVHDLVAAERNVQVVSTHLSHLRDERALQGPELQSIVDALRDEASESDATLLMGDLNEPRSMPSPWLRSILDDFDAASRLDPAPTFENPTPEKRIDYLLVAGASWSSSEVIADAETSDHRPVVAEI